LNVCGTLLYLVQITSLLGDSSPLVTTKISEAVHHLGQKTHNASEAESVSFFKLEWQKNLADDITRNTFNPQKKVVVNTCQKHRD